MKGPSIAVMLGGGHSGGASSKGDEPEESGASETRARAEDAATVFADAVEAKDARRIVKAFSSLSTLCDKLNELADSGEEESEDAEEATESKDAESNEV